MFSTQVPQAILGEGKAGFLMDHTFESPDRHTFNKYTSPQSDLNIQTLVYNSSLGLNKIHK